MIAGKIRKALLVAAVALALPVAAQGQVIYAGAGLLSDGGDIGDVTDAGFLALAGVVFPVASGGFGIGAEGLYSSLGASDGADGSIDILGVLATFGYSFNPDGNVHPYIYGGLGIVNLDADDGSGDGQSETKFGFEGVAGVDFGLSESVGLFVEGRYLGSSGIDVEGGDSISLQALGGAAGISIGIG